MKVLVIAIHIDDAECMTGTASRLIKEGAEVTYLNIKHYQYYNVLYWLKAISLIRKGCHTGSPFSVYFRRFFFKRYCKATETVVKYI